MLVLGIDPGLAATGYGLIKCSSAKYQLVEGGVVRSLADEPIEKRVGTIFSGILEIMDEFRPDVLAIEDLYSHYKHPRTSIIMAHARGAVLIAAYQKDIPVRSYAATKIKSALTGNGRAGKSQMRQMVQSLLEINGPPESWDTYDALAAAICHINYTMKAALT